VAFRHVYSEEEPLTLDDTQSPGEDLSLKELVDALANRIKAITGEATWDANPDSTIAALALGSMVVPTSVSSTPYAATTAPQILLVNTTSASITVNLPTAVGNAGLWKEVVNVGTGANTLTLDPNAAETINGDATVTTTTPNDALKIVSDGANWIITSPPSGA
jgi:hypothetical protein